MFDLSHDPLMQLREFFYEQSEALQNAAVLLGGQPALRCVHALMDDLAIQPSFTRRMKSNFARLQAVLTLQNDHEMNGVEAALFAAIDPASPIVEEICLLSDQLGDLLQPPGPRLSRPRCRPQCDHTRTMQHHAFRPWACTLSCDANSWRWFRNED
ncbi:MAG: hypothetical protein N4A70_02060, partial [Pelagimonas sp.]|nr:hypothetical protein [Pelagimonas sp.]